MSMVGTDGLSDLDVLISLVDEELTSSEQQCCGLVPWERRRALLLDVRKDLVYQQVRAIEARVPDAARGGIGIEVMEYW